MKRTAEILSEFTKKNNEIFKELSDEERDNLKKCLFEIYQDVAKVCEKHNLCIMLGGGSALGAVRHQGFIPWDDDMDAMMPRKDYDKLIEIFDAELGDKYTIGAPRTKETSEILFMHIMKKKTRLICINHVYPEEKSQIRIDIFPIENAPKSKLKRKIIGYFSIIFQMIVYSAGIYKAKNSFYKQCMTSTLKGKIIYYIRYSVGMVLSALFSQKTLFDKCDKFHASTKESEYMTIPTGRKKYYAETLPKNVFIPVSKGMFEEKVVSLPDDVKTYLANLYGDDYMQLPPEEKREKHVFLEFNLDTTKEK